MRHLRFWINLSPLLIVGFCAWFCVTTLRPSAEGRTELDNTASAEQLSSKLAPAEHAERLSAKHAPADHWYAMRAWPDGELNWETYAAGMRQAQAVKQNLVQSRADRVWEPLGPTNVGGRINTIAVHPTDQLIWYVGCAAGGVFKTTDAGVTWTPIFDDQAFLPIGDIEIDPSNPDIIYVGTGDPNVSGYPFVGDGLWRSDDAGDTWTHLGLSETRIISRVRVHPLDPQRLYVAAMGLPMAKDSHRGVFQSTDGGATWNQTLYISDSTGISDLLIDPADPDRVWAAGWDRLRSHFYNIIYGPGAKIYRTTDGGANWNALSGLPGGYQCRIGLDQDPADANHILAQVIGTDFETAALVESFNGGDSWTTLNVAYLNSINAMGGFGWYFAKPRFNPFVPGDVYLCGIQLHQTSNGGAFWTTPTDGSNVHADKHDLVWLSATNGLLATDGGLYETNNGGLSWLRADNIPNTQFYRATLNPHASGEVWGGAQDNGTSAGSMASTPWTFRFGGDGFHADFHPVNPNIVFAESQNGYIGRSSDGGFSFSYWANTLPFSDRRNWDMPYFVSPHPPFPVYAGTYRLHKAPSSLPTDNWAPVSPDLTKGVLTEPRYHNLTALTESPLVPGLLYSGASDGRVQRSDDGSGSWEILDDAGLPNRYITDVVCSFQNPDRVYVTLSGYKSNDNTPMVYSSVDRGDSWVAVAGDLPQLGINNIVVSHLSDSVLFAATDGGVFATTNLGTSWFLLADGMPTVNVYDVELDTATGTLIAATHARSMYQVDVSDLLTPPPPPPSGIAAADLADAVTVYPNPVATEFQVGLPAGEVCHVVLHDAAGKLVWEASSVQGEVAVDASAWPTGVYYLQAYGKTWQATKTVLVE